MKKRIETDPGAALLPGVLLFVLSLQEFAAVLVSALIHELGHILALRLLGVPLYGVRFAVSGPVLRCGDAPNPGNGALCALAGPLLGLVLAGAVFPLWPLCAEISLVFSLVNLLPVLPLDGGRALRSLGGETGRKWLSVLGVALPAAIMAVGLWQFQHGHGLAAVAFGAWLLILSCQEA